MLKISLLRRCLALFLVFHAITGHCNDGANASERLELARQKLVDQALRSSARVDAFSWIDSAGRLHEHQSMRQSFQWPAPLEKSGGGVRDLLLEGSRSESKCGHDAAAPGIYPTLALSTRWPARLPAAQRERMEQAIRTHWLGMNDESRPWRMFPSPVRYASSYDQRLLAPAAPESDWRVELRLELQPAMDQTRERLVWRLALSHQHNLVAEQQVSMDLRVQPQPWEHALWTDSTWQTIEQQLMAWSDLLNSQMACVRPQPQLEAGVSGGWQLNTGRLAGLQVGDEWVLVDPAWLPERALEPGAIGRMVVARVVKVDDMHAELLTLAGDPRLPRPGWVAHPLNLKKAGTPPAPGLQQARR